MVYYDVLSSFLHSIAIWGRPISGRHRQLDSFFLLGNVARRASPSPLATHVQVTAGPPIFLRLEKGSGCILRWHEKGSNSIGTSVGSQRNNS